MNSFSQRLAYLRRDVLGLSQDAFAKRIGVSRGAVANWEVGGDISRENLSRLSVTFDVSMDWLEKAKGPAPGPGAKPSAEKSGIDIAQQHALTLEPTSRARPNLAPEKLSPGRWRQIPIYGQAVAGVDGEFLMNGEAMFYAPAPATLGSPNAYGVRASGESMIPRYFDGEILFVDPDRTPRRGDFVVVQVQMDEHSAPWGYIKQFVRRNTLELVLSQFNPAKELTFPNASVVSVHVVVLAGTT